MKGMGTGFYTYANENADDMPRQTACRSLIPAWV